MGVGVGDIAEEDDDPLIKDGDEDNNVDDEEEEEEDDALFITPPFNVPMAPDVAAQDKDEDVELLSFAYVEDDAGNDFFVD